VGKRGDGEGEERRGVREGRGRGEGRRAGSQHRLCYVLVGGSPDTVKTSPINTSYAV